MTDQQIDALVAFARACGITDDGLNDPDAMQWLAQQASEALDRRWAAESWEARARSLEAVLAHMRAELADDRWDAELALTRIEAALYEGYEEPERDEDDTADASLD